MGFTCQMELCSPVQTLLLLMLYKLNKILKTESSSVKDRKGKHWNCFLDFNNVKQKNDHQKPRSYLSGAPVSVGNCPGLNSFQLWLSTTPFCIYNWSVLSSWGRDSCIEQIIQEIVILNEYQLFKFLGSSMLAAEGLASRRTILIVKKQTSSIAPGTMFMWP